MIHNVESPECVHEMALNCFNKGTFCLIIQTKAWTAMRKIYVYVLYDVFLIHVPLNRLLLSFKIQEINVIDLSHRMIIFVQITCSAKSCHAECISLTAANKA